jgi:hypothetical protein
MAEEPARHSEGPGGDPEHYAHVWIDEGDRGGLERIRWV